MSSHNCGRLQLLWEAVLSEKVHVSSLLSMVEYQASGSNGCFASQLTAAGQAWDESGRCHEAQQVALQGAGRWTRKGGPIMKIWGLC